MPSVYQLLLQGYLRYTYSMEKYQSFIFDSYQFDSVTRQIKLNYSYDDKLHFTEVITLAKDAPLERASTPDFDRALFALHLAGGASYYKVFAPKKIQIRSGKLSQDQADFWNKFYTKGLGEFFYQNKLDWRGHINFPVNPDAPKPLAHQELPVPQKALIPFGGGKDSQVTVEILRRHNINLTLFRMQPHQFITELAEINKLPLLQVGRTISPNFFEIRKRADAYHGHIPITGYVTFLTMTVALLYGYDSVFFSNERSSDYGNVEYLGMQVNHQWSKSNEAERMMTNYLQKYVTGTTRYLNALRPLSELAIAQIFTREPKYFHHVTSCNRNWLWDKLGQDPHQGRWCGECEKCAFVFALFAAFLPMERVIDIFKKNLFEDQNLLSHYHQLWGAEAFKPFQCVGTPEETKAALYLATRRDDWAATFIGQEFVKNELPSIGDPDKLVADALKPDYAGVPPYIAAIIKQELAHENHRA